MCSRLQCLVPMLTCFHLHLSDCMHMSLVINSNLDPTQARRFWKKWFSNVKATTMLLEYIPDRRELLCWSDKDKNETVFATLPIWWLEDSSTDGLRLHTFQILFLFCYPQTSVGRGSKGTLLLDYDLWPLIPLHRWVSTVGSSFPGSHF